MNSETWNVKWINLGIPTQAKREFTIEKFFEDSIPTQSKQEISINELNIEELTK